jgi:hypothetical protein
VGVDTAGSALPTSGQLSASVDGTERSSDAR